MGRAATWQHQHADISPFPGVKIVAELLDGHRMPEAGLVFLNAPVLPTLVDVAPVESVVSLPRVAEVEHFVTSLLQGLNDFWLPGIAPAACWAISVRR